MTAARSKPSCRKMSSTEDTRLRRARDEQPSARLRVGEQLAVPERRIGGELHRRLAARPVAIGCAGRITLLRSAAAASSSGTSAKRTWARRPEPRHTSIKWPMRPKPVTSVTAWTASISARRMPGVLSFVVESMSCRYASALSSPFFSAALMMPTPSGLPSISTSPACARSLRLMRSGWTRPSATSP